MDEAKISVLLHTTANHGDHAAEIAVAYDVKPGETVAGLVDRILTENRPFGAGHRYADHLELRIIRPAPLPFPSREEPS